MPRHPKDPGLIDHIGVDLWRAAQAWKSRFSNEMVARGYVWFGEARGDLLRHIPRAGIVQTALVSRTGMTKQAIQQHLDALERDGVIARVPDPDDARRKQVQFTDAGYEALAAANSVKQLIEDEYRQRLGEEGFAALSVALNLIAEDV